MSCYHLLWAVKNGDLQSIKENMNNLSGVNSTFKNGRTLIHYAADYGQKEICDYLIRNGADLNFWSYTFAWSYRLRIFAGAKLGLAPDGSTYVDCAASEDIRNILRNYITV
ncbi:unnamed protein product [Schistosoma curassoni]|uniref:ANK_REP_REGION domain-containing protein n=1 Tax=Schistosoma curassoni TaxID=6186 RepID=A0A183JHE9_9TREM|nr:unnamed protein product [Schistosoma curassoni]